MFVSLHNSIFKHKIVRFIISGGIGAFTQLSLLYLLVDKLKLWYLLSTMIAFCISIIVSFVMQKSFTFKNKNQKIKSQFLKFFILTSVLFVLNILWMYIFVSIFNIPYLFSQVFTSIINAFISFMVFKSLIFK